ncbi:MAG: ABC transporter permease, partial [Actinomycetia bacterium]|nr:ABC transporter permease [Actinomycetes bacterium]
MSETKADTGESTAVDEEVEDSSGAGDERLAYRGLGQRMLVRPEIVGLLASVLLYMFFWGVTRPFGNAGGIATVLDVSATLGIMAVAVAVLMIGGEFDLSSG